MNLLKGNIRYFVMLAGIMILDQIVKYLTVTLLSPGRSIPVIEGIFHITYVQNTGAAFSILAGKLGILTAFTGLVLAFLMYYFIKNSHTMSPVLKCCYIMIVAGGAGNLIDRVSRGFVVDSFDFRIWPVFNIADISICGGCALLIFYVLFIESRAKKK